MLFSICHSCCSLKASQAVRQSLSLLLRVIEHHSRLRGRTNARGRGLPANESGAGLGSAHRVVVVPVRRLLQFKGGKGWYLDELGGDDRADDQDQEQEEHREVEDGVADNAALAKLRLLERVDWRTDLATGRLLANASDYGWSHNRRTLAAARKA